MKTDILLQKGLELISRGKHNGLKKGFVESAGYDITKGVTSENIALELHQESMLPVALTQLTQLKSLDLKNPQEVEMAATTLNEFKIKFDKHYKVQKFLNRQIKWFKKEGNKTLQLFYLVKDGISEL